MGTIGKLFAGVASAALLSSCAGGIGAGGSSGAIANAGEARSISAEERAQGQKVHPQLVQEFGGAYTAPQSAYVTRVGQKIAVQSGLGATQNDFTVTLLNSPVNNAFAIPGGYIYLTRQLMGLMNDEAEMAGVLGHEVGHVAARHSQKRQQRSRNNSLLGVLGQVAGGLLGDNSGIAGALGGALQQYSGTVAQLATLGYSRGQEHEADDLGVRYLDTAGYDTMALSSMLQSLAAQTALDARIAGRDARSVPEWASTHPDPAQRVSRAARVAQQVDPTGGVRNREVFLQQLDGMLYGDDPKQGVIEGDSFIHPDLRFRFTVPNGFTMQNGARAVSITGQSGQAQFTTAAYNGDMSRYIAAAFKAVAGETQLTPTAIQRTTVNGMPAAYSTARANTQNGEIDVTVFAYEFSKSQAFHFVALTPAGRGNLFVPMYNSVDRLTTAQAAQIKPRKIDVVQVRSGESVASLARRMAYTDMQLERFLVLNGLPANAQLQAGQMVKIVTY